MSARLMSKSEGSGDMSETLARIRAKQAALAGMQGGQPVDHDPDTAARLAAIEQRKAVLQDEMSRSGSEWGDDYARMQPAPAAQAPMQAGLPAIMPGREMRPQTPSPSATGAPPIPSPVGMPRTLGDYGIEASRNLPGSLESLGQGLWDAAQDPVGTAKGIGQTVLGGAQLGKDYLGVPSNEMLGDFRPQARAAGEHFERYGPDRITDTFRRDPAATMVDIGGLAAGGVGAGARAATMGARFGRNIMDIEPPAPRPAPPPRQQTPSRREFIEGAPSTEALGKQADVFFEAARRSGVRFSSTEFGPFRKKIVRKLREEGADQVLHPKVMRLVGLIEDAPPGVAPDMGHLMVLRRQFGAAAGDIDKDTSRLGSLGIDLIDDFVESGSSATSSIAKDGRKLWVQMRQSEMIERAMEKATTAQQGVEAGLRAEFKSLYRAYVDKKKNMRGVSPELAKAIKAVAEGTATSNTLRRIASLSGGSGPQRAVQNLIQGSAVGGGLGFALGGPAGAALGAAAGPVAGHAAGRLATRAAQQRANMARAIAARGETRKQAGKRPQDMSLAEVMADVMS